MRTTVTLSPDWNHSPEPFSFDCCGADAGHGMCMLDPDHTGDHCSGAMWFWADDMPPYRLKWNERRGMHGQPEPLL